MTEPKAGSFIVIPKLYNLRDVGGYALPSNGTIRRHLLYRSATIHECDMSALKQLRDEHGITHIYDLRSLPEIIKGGGSEVLDARCREADIERVRLSVFPDDDYSPEKLAERIQGYSSGASGFADIYLRMLTKGAGAYRTILLHLSQLSASSSSPQGILVHCRAGRDRTELPVYLLYSLLGMPEEMIAKEYALSNEGLAPLLPEFRERALATGAFDRPDGTKDMEALQRRMILAPEAMHLTMKLVKKEWGSAEGYVRDVLGLSDQDIQNIRDTFVVKGVRGTSERPSGKDI